MRTLAAIILSGLLAVMAYGIFWLVCLNYTTAQLRGVMRESLNADMSYGTPQWVPDPAHVTMDLPAATLRLENGPVREVRASSLRLASGFLMRDRWTMTFPQRVEVKLASGSTLLLETKNGQVMWVKEGDSISFKADSARLLDLHGNELGQIGDVMLERKSSDNGVRINLASRPRYEGGEGTLSGQVVLPPSAFGNVVNLMGDGGAPGLKEIMHSVAGSLYRNSVAGDAAGAELEFENLSFRSPGGQSGAVYGKISVRADGRLTGKLSVTSDNVATMAGWVERARLLNPQRRNEELGAARFTRSLPASRATVGMENMQETLLLNGQPVGPLPNVLDVVNRLWP